MLNDEEVVFLISSVIDTPHSILSLATRVQETEDTIRSIHIYYPTCQIILIEGGHYEWDLNSLRSLHSNIYVIKHNVLSEPKSIGEAKLILAGLESDCFQDLSTHIQRIFKISGRYKLNERFKKHDHTGNKITLLQQTSTSRAPMKVTITVLYSVPISKLHMYKHCLHQSIQNMATISFDIEHALFYSITNEEDFHYLDQLGVQGLIGPSGAYWEA